MNNTLFSDCPNQKACDAAKIGTYTGAGLGTVGSALAVVGAGANIMGLASIGSAVGGGVLAGVGTLVAAPIVAAAAVGGATYWWFNRDSGEETESVAKPTTDAATDAVAAAADAATDVADAAADAATDAADAATDAAP
jgi:hypothetical protein